MLEPVLDGIWCRETEGRMSPGGGDRWLGRCLTYLALCGSGFIVAIWGSTEGSAGAVSTGADTATLGKVLFSLGLPDLDLGLFAATT